MSKALLMGATGLVGKAVAGQLAGVDLVLLSRRATRELPIGAREIIEPANAWSMAIAAETPAIVINCLGTTIKQAGSQAAFHAVDHDLVLAVATAAKAAGTRQLISVSSVGASVRSSNFYLNTKGATEAGLSALSFDRLDIMRPGLLMGKREGPPRLGESMAMIAAPLTNALLHGGLRRYRSIAAGTVAKAIVALVERAGGGTYVHENDALHRLAD